MDATGQNHWLRVRQLFDQAIELEGESRERFLQATAGEAQAIKEVRSLLLRASSTGSGPVWAGEDSEPDSPAPERAGGYRIVREVGRGGMGVVYEAVGGGELGRRRVAIKLVQRGMGSQSVVERFRRERAILAQLEHPYITRLYEAGTTEDGQLYFVMEYVDGESWQEAMAKRPLAGRMRLLAMVCEAVEHAHKQQIVHRDLKPSNVLVTGDGKVKLLDFGAARLLDAADPDKTLAGPRPYTPRYSSPEVRAGLGGTEAADVYSLGRMLSDFAGGDRDAEAIGARAMREEAAARYPSVTELRADLERHLRDEPVAARQGNLIYRGRKLARRYGRAALAAAMIAAAVAAGGASTWRAMSVAEVERQRAEQRLDGLRALSRVVIAAGGPRYELVTRTAPYLGELMAAKYPPELLEALDRYCGIAAAAQQGRIVDQACSRAFGEALRRTVEQSPRAAARGGEGDVVWLALVVSRMWSGLRQDAEAIRWSEFGLRHAGAGPASLDRVALRLELANLEYRKDHWDRYLTKLEEALMDWRSLPERAAAEPGLLLSLAYQFTLGDADDEARFVLERMLARNEREAYPVKHRIDLFQQLANHARWQGRHERAIQLSRTVVTLIEAQTEGMEQLQRASDARLRLGDALRDSGRKEAAVAEYRRGYRLAQRTLEIDPQSQEGPVAVDTARLKLGEGLFVAQHFAEAASHLEKVCERRWQVWKAHPEESFLARDAAYALGVRMRTLSSLSGRTAEAIAMGERALEALAGFAERDLGSGRHRQHALEIHAALATLEERAGKLERGAAHRREIGRLRGMAEAAERRNKVELRRRLSPLRPTIATLIDR